MLYEVLNRDEFFRILSDNYKEILNEFLTSDIELMPFPWRAAPLYNILNVMGNHLDKFPTISDNMKFVDGYTIVSIGIGLLNKDDSPAPHVDLHPSNGNFKRYHLPLQLTDTSFMYIQEDGECKKYRWELGKWMLFTGIDKIHHPLNGEEKDRIVLVVDTFEGDVCDKDIYEYYEVIENLGARLNTIDFRPYYEEYIKKKTLL